MEANAGCNAVQVETLLSVPTRSYSLVLTHTLLCDLCYSAVFHSIALSRSPPFRWLKLTRTKELCKYRVPKKRERAFILEVLWCGTVRVFDKGIDIGFDMHIA